MSLQHMDLWIIFLFASAVASDRCPPASLQLHPSELVVEYGGSLEVNCTSLNNSAVKWQIRPDLNDLMEPYDLWNTRWTVENLQEWDIEAQCILILNNSLTDDLIMIDDLTDNLTDFQCYENLSLTVYKAPENVSITLVNHTEVMGDGRQYELQCDVLDVAPVQNLTVRWYRENVTVNESRFTDTERGPRNVSASLLISPTREDDGVLYRCEAELDLGPLGPNPPLTRSFDQLHITVKKDLSLWTDAERTAVATMPTSAITTTATVTTGTTGVPTSTPLPDILSNIDIVAVSPGAMAVGKNYTLSCHIEIPQTVGNVTVKMYIGQVLLNTEIIENWGDRNITSDFLYTALIKHNGEKYQCVVEFQQPGKESFLEHKSNTLNIDVYSGCPVAINPSTLVVRYGGPASSTCRSSSPIGGMGWESPVGAVGMEEGVTELNWTVKELREWTVTPQCFINREGGQCSKELSVVAFTTPDSLTITTKRHSTMAVGKDNTLTCHIGNIAPVQSLTVKWFKQVPVDGSTVPLPDDERHQSSISIGPQNLTSDYMITPHISDNGTQYWCEAELDLGPGGPPKLTSAPLTIIVYSGCPIDISPSTLVVRYGDSASADCRALIPHNGIGWNSTLGPVSKVRDIQHVTWNVESLTEWSVKPKCVIDTDDEQCGQDLNVSVYSIPDVITLTANIAGAMAEGKTYSLFCHIENIAPVQNLTVKWFKRHTVYGSTVERMLMDDPKHQSISSISSQNITSDLLIAPHISDNGAQYWCEAELDLGPGGPPKLTSAPLTIIVYSGCPIDISPSPLVVRYGDSASADCRALIPHNGIGWNSTLGPVSKVRDIQHVTWNVESLTEWSVKPKCVIDTDDGQCSKLLNVIVYQMPSSITLTTNHTGKMTAGKDYIFTCHIQNVAPAQNLIVMWFKGQTLLNEPHKYQGTGEGPQNLTFDLRIQPTASDDGAQYRCKAQLDLGPALLEVESNHRVINIPADWTTTIIIIFLIFVLIILVLILAFRYLKSKQGNYSVVQTHIPLTETPNGNA
ncbi:hypothetical protein AALO_G00075850 [Alosa alosa]|uniref:Ig-like domain-containing protein n=1 Tax=Alosa alosa TaxID=278164 RepID=A0AAV6H0X6_9TELE|nr:hypothetical protein AALO_G00075850 [Alosa alosa]